MITLLWRTKQAASSYEAIEQSERVSALANSIKKDAEWAEAKKKCRLNEETIKMAKEMGLNPRDLIKNIPSKSEQWKAPVGVWIREMYEKRQEKAFRKKVRKRENHIFMKEGEAE